MPYIIRRYRNTSKFRVCKRGTRKCFSKRGIALKVAKRQRAAIIIHTREIVRSLVGQSHPE